jgi:hypothetical protein
MAAPGILASMLDLIASSVAVASGAFLTAYVVGRLLVAMTNPRR